MKKMMCFLVFFLSGLVVVVGGSVYLDKVLIDLIDKVLL